MRVCGVGGHEVERRVACSDDVDGAIDDVGAVAVGEIAVGAEWFECADDVGKEGRSRGLEIDKQG